MSYQYADERAGLLTDEGQRRFLAVRDNTFRLLKIAGAVRAQEAMSTPNGPSDSWQQLACLDRMVELGEISEITPARVAAQHRVFVMAKEV